MAVLDLRFCARAFSSCGKWGPLFIAVRGPLTIAASLVAEHRLQTRRLSNCGSRACGIFPDQGSNICPCTGRQILNHCATREALRHLFYFDKFASFAGGRIAEDIIKVTNDLLEVHSSLRHTT